MGINISVPENAININSSTKTTFSLCQKDENGNSDCTFHEARLKRFSCDSQACHLKFDTDRSDSLLSQKCQDVDTGKLTNLFISGLDLDCGRMGKPFKSKYVPNSGEISVTFDSGTEEYERLKKKIDNFIP